MVRTNVVSKIIFCDNEWVTTSHFARNPEVGGIPARLAKRIVDVRFISISEFSFLFFFESGFSHNIHDSQN